MFGSSGMMVMVDPTGWVGAEAQARPTAFGQLELFPKRENRSAGNWNLCDETLFQSFSEEGPIQTCVAPEKAVPLPAPLLRKEGLGEVLRCLPTPSVPTEYRGEERTAVPSW